MNAIRIRTHVESETLRLPQIKDLIGKDVEIIILEEQQNPGRDFAQFLEAAGRDLVDPDAYRQLRAASMI